MRKNRFFKVLTILYFFISFIFGIGYCICELYRVPIDGLLFVVTNNIEGTSWESLYDAIRFIIIYLLVASIVYIFFYYFFVNRTKEFKLRLTLFNHLFNIDLRKHNNGLFAILLIIYSCASFIHIDNILCITQFIKNYNVYSSIYEKFYVNAKDVEVKAKENTNNLIIIYLESMETTFSSKEYGGYMDTNLINNLTNLAINNINFSCTDSFGGFNSVSTAGNTNGAKFAGFSATGFNYGMGNEMDPDLPYASKLTMLGDILNDNGYCLEAIECSDSRFAGERSFFLTHHFEMYDCYNALDDGYINNFVWFGMDDKTTYKIAEDELLRLSSLDKPFGLVICLCDTHATGGYLCDLCENKYSEQYKNVIDCCDRQVFSFLEWAKQQDFYEDTTIILLGDHPTMDGSLVKNVEYKNRYVYNCFINSLVNTDNTKNRQCNTFDLFPTILASIGFEIEGDKIGFGTNLFSGIKTLQEEVGLDYINNELQQRSHYFIDNFY